MASKKKKTVNKVAATRKFVVNGALAGRHVVVRTKSAGVHVGTFVSLNSGECVLRDVRRVWRWRGAHTLNEMAVTGIDSAAKSGYSRVSEPVDMNVLTGAIEVIPMTKHAYASIMDCGWAP